MDFHLRPPCRFSQSLHPPTQHIQNQIPQHHHQDVLNNTLSPSSLVRPPTFKILPLTFQTIQPPHPTPSVPRELNPTQPLVQDTSVVNTDFNFQPWPPSSSPSLPASSEHSPQPPQLLQHQDFVLYPPQSEPQHSRPFSQTRSNRANRQNNNLHRTFGSSTLSAPERKALLSTFQAWDSPRTAASNQRQQPCQRPPVPLFPQTEANNKNMELGNAHRSVSSHDMSCSHQYGSDIDLEPFVPFEGGATAPDFSSPAQPALNFDMSSSHSSSNFSTVSPNDLLMPSDLSNPGSAAFTNLTTPSAFDGSPCFDDAWDTPLFDVRETPESWAPLFHDAQVIAPSATPAGVDQSPSTSSEDFEPARGPSEHRKSSASSSPSGRHSLVAGVNPRRRSRPLPPITVNDPTDVVSMKRAKNTLAARKSRQRKADRMEDLEQKYNEMKAKYEKLEAEHEKVQAERDHWKTVAATT